MSKPRYLRHPFFCYVFIVKILASCYWMFYVLPICLDVSCKSCGLTFHKYNIDKREKILVWIWNFNYCVWSLFDAFRAKISFTTINFFSFNLLLRVLKFQWHFSLIWPSSLQCPQIISFFLLWVIQLIFEKGGDFNNFW